MVGDPAMSSFLGLKNAHFHTMGMMPSAIAIPNKLSIQLTWMHREMGSLTESPERGD